MRVFIDKEVHLQIEAFYEAAMRHHITLDEATVIKKIDRLYDAMESLGTYAEIYPLARLNRAWISKGYQEFICEDFLTLTMIHPSRVRAEASPSISGLSFSCWGVL